MKSSSSQTQKQLRSIENIPTPSTNVYVCFLPTTMTQDTLQKMFEKFGKILSIKLSKRKDGFTYSHIFFETIQQAHLAIKAMDKLKIQNKTLKVNFASQVPKTINKKVVLIEKKLKNQNQKEKEEEKEKEKEEEKDVITSSQLVLQKIPSKKSNKKTKKQKKKEVKAQNEEEKKIKREVKYRSKSSKKVTKQQEKQSEIVQLEADYEIKKQAQYEKKFLQDQEITQTQWSQDFDPADLKKRPFSTFIL